MPLYENVFIVRQEMSQQQVEAISERFTAIVKESGGTVAKAEYWGLRNLAFKIKKNRKGHYMLLNIDAPAAAVNELERNMRISEDVLRYQTVRVEALEEGPSAVLRSKSSRDDDRPRRDRYEDYRADDIRAGERSERGGDRVDEVRGGAV